MQTMVPLYGFGGGGGTGASLTVTAPAGCTVTVSKDGKTKTKTAGADGVAVFRGLATGQWTVTITDGTDTATDTVNLVADYTKAMSFVKIYGVRRGTGVESPTWARTDEAVGMTATASVGTVSGRSDFDSCYPWSGIQRLTLSTGDVVVKIPKFWFRRYREGDIEYIRIADKPTDGFELHKAFKRGGKEVDYIYAGAYKTSDNNKSVPGARPQGSQTRAVFRNNAKAKGDGWGIIDIATVSAIQMLILVEFANNNVQSVIGRGCCDNSLIINTGSCDSVPNLTGIPSGTDGLVDVVWRGLEGFWGSVWEFVDGINMTGDTYYVCNDPSKYADDTAEGYETLSFVGSSSWSLSYITQEGLDTGNNPHIMLPSAAGSGSDSTYYCDCVWSHGAWGCLARGGGFNGSRAGLFAGLFTNGSSISAYDFGSRLQYIPQ